MKKPSLILLLLIGLGSISYAQTITIGAQVWMSKNLDVATFRNGDPIPQAKELLDWEKAGRNKQPAWCYYNNDSANGEKYGKLYNWYAVNDKRGLAPVGYHIPSDEEWTICTDYLGGKDRAGTKMKSTSGWLSSYGLERNGNGTNSSGFSGLPGGYCNHIGAFKHIGRNGYWWSSTVSSTSWGGSGWYRALGCHYRGVDRQHDGNIQGFSVRCLRD